MPAFVFNNNLVLKHIHALCRMGVLDKIPLPNSEKQDPLGVCIRDFFRTGVDKPMRSWVNGKEEPLMYPSIFFRKEKEMNEVEFTALSLVQGQILDVGAGAGCHSLLLQLKGHHVTSIETSEYSCEVMQQRGISDVVHGDIMRYSGKKFDTILLLMNGFGIAGDEESLPAFLKHLKSLLNEGGRILGESTDIFYIHQTERGVTDIDLSKGYYGEVEFKVRYGSLESTFPWIYPDEYLLEEIALEAGFKMEIPVRGDRYNFLCELRAV